MAEVGSGMAGYVHARQRQAFGPPPTPPSLTGPVAGLALASLAALTAPFLAGLATSRGGPAVWTRQVSDLALMFGIGFAVLVLPVAWAGLSLYCVLAPGRRWTRRLLGAVLCLACAVGEVALTWSDLHAHQRLRMAAFDRLGRRAEPLVEALWAYQRDHGQAAPSLDALVPRYLAAVPGTGMRGYPAFRYEPASGSRSCHSLPDGGRLALDYDGGHLARVTVLRTSVEAEHWRALLASAHDFAYSWRDQLDPLVSGAPTLSAPPEGAWRLWVDCGFGLGFDTFYYQPTECYPAYAYGGVTERLGRWAYVHE